jgi:hypothetical protein
MVALKIDPADTAYRCSIITMTTGCSVNIALFNIEKGAISHFSIAVE